MVQPASNQDELSLDHASRGSRRAPGLAMLACAVVALALVLLGEPRAPFLLVVTSVLAVKGALDTWPRPKRRSLRRVATAIASSFVAGLISLGARATLPSDLDAPAGGAAETLFDILIMFLLVAVLLGAFGGLALLLRFLAGVFRWGFVGGVLRSFLGVAASVLTVLSLVAVFRGATRPSVDEYVARLKAQSTGTSEPSLPHCIRSSMPLRPVETHLRQEGDLVLASRCVEYWDCDVGIVGADEARLGEEAPLPFTVPYCAKLSLQRISPDFVRVRATWQTSRFYDSVTSRDALFHRVGGHWVPAKDTKAPPSDSGAITAGKASPPRAWTAWGLLGLLFTALALMERRRAIFRVTAARAAEAEDVISAQEPSTIEDDVVRYEAWALAVASLAAAPLVGAALAGLVF